jgi:hypothetical protein
MPRLDEWEMPPHQARCVAMTTLRQSLREASITVVDGNLGFMDKPYLQVELPGDRGALVTPEGAYFFDEGETAPGEAGLEAVGQRIIDDFADAARFYESEEWEHEDRAAREWHND